MDGFVIVTEAVRQRIASESEEPKAKRARTDVAVERCGLTLAVSEVTRECMQTALEAHFPGASSSVTVAEESPVGKGTAGGVAFRIHVAGPSTSFPRMIVCGDVTIPVFVHRRLPGTPGSVAPTDSPLVRPVLLVGAGGIGCELLKVLVLAGFRHIEVIDLDTIDATNLNRQFLFGTADVGQPKAVTAQAAVLRWFDHRNTRFPRHAAAPPAIVAYHDNVKDTDKFSESFYGRFAAVLNALDNVSARQHVNRMCMSVGVPLFESGTMGYNGQVQPIVKGVFECYDCRPKPADQKTYAVCTIHARPTTMVHSVHFAKELYETLFGERSLIRTCRHQTGQGGTGASEVADAGELVYLVDIVKGWAANTNSSSGSGKDPDGASLLSFGLTLVECLFRTKIQELLAMKSVWSIEPPVPLDDSIVAAIEGLPTALSVRAISRDARLSLADNVRLFLHAAAGCACRVADTRHDDNDGDASVVVPFKKEDDLAVDFVAATANLRAHAFHIAGNSVEELRSIAGAIVPAIATTNAMVAAGVVQQLLRYYGSGAGPTTPDCSMVYVRKAPLMKRRAVRETPLLFAVERDDATENPQTLARKRRARMVPERFLMHSVAPSAPSKDCPVCSKLAAPTVTVTVATLSGQTLGDLVRAVLEGALGMECPSVMVGSRIVYEEEDYEELVGEPLSALSSGAGFGLCLVVDALNKDIEWQVILRECTDSTSAPPFTVRGIEEATEAEASALAARSAKEAEAAAELAATARATQDEEARRGATSGDADAVVGGTADTAMDLDGDANTAGTVGPADDNGDDVVQID